MRRYILVLLLTLFIAGCQIIVLPYPEATPTPNGTIPPTETPNGTIP